MDEERTELIRVTGRVQGVGFRAWTRREAQVLGLSGWVRNEADGAVTVLVSGPADTVARMIGLIERGPAGAGRFGRGADGRRRRRAGWVRGPALTPRGVAGHSYRSSSQFWPTRSLPNEWWRSSSTSRKPAAW